MAKVYGLLGRNISYSFSRTYFAEKFKKEGLHDCQYRNFDLDRIEDITGVLKDTTDLAGLNVTIPYKEAIMSFLDEIDAEAAAIGAVNTIKFEQGALHGYNTDVSGFSRALQPLLRPEIEKALVLGTGGASKAVIYALNKMGIEVTRVSRRQLPNDLTYNDISAEVMQTTHLIVNCTPLGTYPDIAEKPSLPYTELSPKHLLFDLVYNPEITAFMHEGLSRGAKAVNGYAMLVGQAERSWEIWNGKTP